MSPELAAVAFGLLSALSWGSGDFSGGVASRRLPAASVALWANVAGCALFVLIALVRAEPFVARDVPWAVAAGAAGSLGLTCLYLALSKGHMGLVAPVTAVVAAVPPVLVGAALEGPPGPVQYAGFALGLVGVWLASKPEGAVRPAGLGYALLSGLGFGLFFVFIDRVEGLFWPATVQKFAAVLVILVLVLRLRPALPGRGLWPLMLLAGALDAGGNLFFMVAAQSGRLDVAAVTSSLYPAFTVLLAWIVLRERLQGPQLLGVGLAFAAIVLIAAG